MIRYLLFPSLYSFIFLASSLAFPFDTEEAARNRNPRSSYAPLNLEMQEEQVGGELSQINEATKSITEFLYFNDEPSSIVGHDTGTQQGSFYPLYPESWFSFPNFIEQCFSDSRAAQIKNSKKVIKSILEDSEINTQAFDIFCNEHPNGFTSSQLKAFFAEQEIFYPPLPANYQSSKVPPPDRQAENESHDNYVRRQLLTHGGVHTIQDFTPPRSWSLFGTSQNKTFSPTLIQYPNKWPYVEEIHQLLTKVRKESRLNKYAVRYQYGARYLIEELFNEQKANLSPEAKKALHALELQTKYNELCKRECENNDNEHEEISEWLKKHEQFLTNWVAEGFNPKTKLVSLNKTILTSVILNGKYGHITEKEIKAKERKLIAAESLLQIERLAQDVEDSVALFAKNAQNLKKQMEAKNKAARQEVFRMHEEIGNVLQRLLPPSSE